jgi:putative flavoprotein involved in K+ transport
MGTIDTIVIGAGHAGLAVSRLLTEAGHDHVVLERGRLAESWRSARWDSLHLLTPNWMTRLPGWVYAGPDHDGYMSAGRLVRHLEAYAASFRAPVLESTTVERVTPSARGYEVVTDRGTWTAAHVVIATGPHGWPHVPGWARRMSEGVQITTASRYRSPAGLPAGGVLVVGASSTGVQLADELARAGRDVVLSVGRHTRMPRRYRGMDIFWWLERTGRMARTIDEVPDPAAARREPSMQLVGRNEPDRWGADSDLTALQDLGVRLTGRLTGAEGRRATFAPDLPESVAQADGRMHRFLDVVDRHIGDSGLEPEVWPAARPRAIRLDQVPSTLDLRASGISTVLLATGYRPHHPWLHVPVTTVTGAIRQHRGATPAPGLYVVGQRFQHRRDSAMIDGARHDAQAVVSHLLSSAGHGATGAAQLESWLP